VAAISIADQWIYKNDKKEEIMEVDAHGQPGLAINWHRNLIKSVESLLGICRGLIADNQLNTAEIGFLDTWLRENQEVARAWPGDVIARRIAHILSDGVVTDEEARDLKETLSQITGGFLDHGAPSGTATIFPTESVHSILFDNTIFCFTGKFIYGSRARCQMATEALGGMCIPDVTQKLHFLVIGALASRDWINTSFGRKIEKAVQLRNAGHSVRIISEETWTQFV
jgi:NAD-dependent DNA ligase